MNGKQKPESELHGFHADRLITDDAETEAEREESEVKERVRNAFLSAYGEQSAGGPSLRGFVVVVLFALIVVLAIGYAAMRT